MLAAVLCPSLDVLGNHDRWRLARRKPPKPQVDTRICHRWAAGLFHAYHGNVPRKTRRMGGEMPIGALSKLSRLNSSKTTRTSRPGHSIGTILSLAKLACRRYPTNFSAIPTRESSGTQCFPNAKEQSVVVAKWASFSWKVSLDLPPMCKANEADVKNIAEKIAKVPKMGNLDRNLSVGPPDEASDDHTTPPTLLPNFARMVSVANVSLVLPPLTASPAGLGLTYGDAPGFMLQGVTSD